MARPRRAAARARWLRWPALLLLLAAVAAARQAGNTPEFTSPPELPDAIVGQPYRVQLAAGGGDPPYVWSIVRGALPPDLHLDTGSGEMTGVLRAGGVFRFTLGVASSATPDDVRPRQFTLPVLAGLTAAWTDYPAVSGVAINGSVQVSSRLPLDFTLICVAVNAVHKAFTLGYQHFTLTAAGAHIPFGASLPGGDYVVNVDAIGEDLGTGTVYHVRLVTAAPLHVPVP